MDVTTLADFLPAETCVQVIQPHEVCRKLLAVQPTEANGPDNVPCRILKDFAYKLAEPVATIFNASLTSVVVLQSGKTQTLYQSKTQSPRNEGDLCHVDDWTISGIR